MENELHCELQLVEPTSPIVIYIDRTRIEQVFANFIFNAIKYTPKGDTIAVSLILTDSQINIMVSDTGIGISEEALPHIFDRYYRDRSEFITNTSGTGLGLAISKEIVDFHYGKVGAYSHLHVGTTFYFTLPVFNEDGVS